MRAHLDLPTLAARARGLRVHLLRRSDLETLAGATDLASFARALVRTDAVPEGIPGAARVADVQAAVRRMATYHLRRLERWAGHGGALDLFYAEVERRALRSLLRGAIQGAPSEARLAGALPTPRLPERALRELARQPTAARVALQLVVLRHPDAGRLLPLVARAQPVLFELDLALVRGFAGRVLAACRAGDANLRTWGHGRIDLANVETALALASGPAELEPSACFVEGGEALPLQAFVDAARASSRAEAASMLARALRGTQLGETLRASQGDPVRLEREALARLLVDQRREARVDPLGSAPVVLFLLRLEAQTRDLLRMAWGASLGAPAAILAADLVTPWS